MARATSTADVRNGSKADVRVSVQKGWLADIAGGHTRMHNRIVIKVVTSETGSLGLPEFAEGSRLRELIQQIAAALGTTAK